MSQKFTKEELKSPDAVLDVLTHMMAWVQKHMSTLGIILGIFIGIGTLTSAVSWFSSRNERTANDKFYSISKQYQDKRSAFEEAESKKPALDKDGKPTKEAAASNTIKATGHLEQDYGSIPKEFLDFLRENASNQAGRTAALTLAELYIKYHKTDEALDALKLTESSLKPKELLSALIIHQMATLLANKNNCQNALEMWGKIVKNKEVQYLEKDVKIRMGLCYEALGDKEKAKAYFTEVSTKGKEERDNATTLDAGKYLRLMNAQTRGS